MFSRTQMGWQPCAWAGSLRRGCTLVPGEKAHSRLTDAQHWALSPQGAGLVWHDSSLCAQSPAWNVCLTQLLTAPLQWWGGTPLGDCDCPLGYVCVWYE